MSSGASPRYGVDVDDDWSSIDWDEIDTIQSKSKPKPNSNGKRSIETNPSNQQSNIGIKHNITTDKTSLSTASATHMNNDTGAMQPRLNGLGAHSTPTNSSSGNFTKENSTSTSISPSLTSSVIGVSAGVTNVWTNRANLNPNPNPNFISSNPKSRPPFTPTAAPPSSMSANWKNQKSSNHPNALHRHQPQHLQTQQSKPTPPSSGPISAPQRSMPLPLSSTVPNPSSGNIWTSSRPTAQASSLPLSSSSSTSAAISSSSSARPGAAPLTRPTTSTTADSSSIRPSSAFAARPSQPPPPPSISSSNPWQRQNFAPLQQRQPATMASAPPPPPTPPMIPAARPPINASSTHHPVSSTTSGISSLSFAAPQPSPSNQRRPSAPLPNSSSFHPLGPNFIPSAKYSSSSSSSEPSSPRRTSHIQTSVDFSSLCQKYLAEDSTRRVNPIDPHTIGTYLYPRHLSSRQYQREIVWTALRYNTLACLPTGTGKTLIAAVCLHNFYRWYPRGKLLFVAPTRPLVLQQHRACAKMMLGVPDSSMAVLVGGGGGRNQDRAVGVWESDQVRIIFATPQAIIAHIEKDLVQLNEIVFVCVDECHKASGKYSYVTIIQHLLRSNHEFRVLGLSATPGTDMMAVKAVTKNLLIQRFELRDESDDELRSHMHEKQFEKVVIHPTKSTAEIETMLNQCIKPHLIQLRQLQVFDYVEPKSIYPMTLQTAMKNFQTEHQKSRLGDKTYFHALGLLGLCRRLLVARDMLKSSTKQCMEYLRQHIIGDELGKVVDTNSKNSLDRKQPTLAIVAFRESVSFIQLRTLIEKNLATLQIDVDEHTPIRSSRLSSSSPSSSLSSSPSAIDLAQVLSSTEFQHKLEVVYQHHPKCAKLIELVTRHFSQSKQKEEWLKEDVNDSLDNGGASDHDSDEDATILRLRGCASQSNVIVFANSRNSVDEIMNHCEMFRELCGIRAAKFVGQQKNGMTQQEQSSILAKFTSGELNVLIATSVAEEGLDIGDIDLVISYDVARSPIKLIQRNGRAGRRREGKCFALCMAGADEQKYDRALSEKRKFFADLRYQGKIPNFLQQFQSLSNRMIPTGIVPAEILTDDGKTPPMDSMIQSTHTNSHIRTDVDDVTKIVLSYNKKRRMVDYRMDDDDQPIEVDDLISPPPPRMSAIRTSNKLHQQFEAIARNTPQTKSTTAPATSTLSLSSSSSSTSSTIAQSTSPSATANSVSSSSSSTIGTLFNRQQQQAKQQRDERRTMAIVNKYKLETFKTWTPDEFCPPVNSVMSDLIPHQILQRVKQLRQSAQTKKQSNSCFIYRTHAQLIEEMLRLQVEPINELPAVNTEESKDAHDHTNDMEVDPHTNATETKQNGHSETNQDSLISDQSSSGLPPIVQVAPLSSLSSTVPTSVCSRCHSATPLSTIQPCLLCQSSSNCSNCVDKFGRLCQDCADLSETMSQDVSMAGVEQEYTQDEVTVLPTPSPPQPPPPPTVSSANANGDVKPDPSISTELFRPVFASSPARPSPPLTSSLMVTPTPSSTLDRIVNPATQLQPQSPTMSPLQPLLQMDHSIDNPPVPQPQQSPTPPIQSPSTQLQTQFRVQQPNQPSTQTNPIINSEPLQPSSLSAVPSQPQLQPVPPLSLPSLPLPVALPMPMDEDDEFNDFTPVPASLNRPPIAYTSSTNLPTSSHLSSSISSSTYHPSTPVATPPSIGTEFRPASNVVFEQHTYNDRIYRHPAPSFNSTSITSYSHLQMPHIPTPPPPQAQSSPPHLPLSSFNSADVFDDEDQPLTSVRQGLMMSRLNRANTSLPKQPQPTDIVDLTEDEDMPIIRR